MSAEYCVPCQDAHQMTNSCLQDVQCKMCGKKGHLRIDCPGQEEHTLEEQLQHTSKQSQEYFEEEIVDDIDRNFGPDDKDFVRCTMKRKNSIKDLFPSKAVEYPDMFRNCEAVEKIGTSEIGDSLMTYKIMKRTPCANSSNIPVESVVGIEEQILDSCTSIKSEDSCMKNVGDSCLSESNGNGICMTDDKVDHINPKNKAKGKYTGLIEWTKPEQGTAGAGYPHQDEKTEMSEKIEEESQIFKPAEIFKLKPENFSNYTQLQVSKTQEKKSPMLKGGTYHIVSFHIELLKSNKSPSTKLTQIGCVVSGSNLTTSSFFRAIKPYGLEKYLDTYRMGGDLLQALHMTRDEDGTFQFRSQFEMVEDDQKIVCVEESEALKSFLDFLENFSNCVLLGVDEDSVSILVKKLKKVNKLKFGELVNGFTYWKRVLKYLDVDGYRTLDLEEYYTKMMSEDLPSFTTASDIAEVLLKTVMEVKAKNMGTSYTTLFYKLCKRIELLENPLMVEYDRNATVESVEVFSSFGPTVSATFTAEKLEQVTVSSDTESEEKGRKCPEVDIEGLYSTAALSDKAVCGFITTKAENCGGVLNDSNIASSQCGYWEENMTTPDAEKSSQPVRPTWLKCWQIGAKSGGEGTVICPGLRTSFVTSVKCGSQVKYSNIYNHLMTVHNGLRDVLHCANCRIPVSPSSVPRHMSKCFSAGAAARDVWLGKRSSLPSHLHTDMNYNYVDKSINPSISPGNFINKKAVFGGTDEGYVQKACMTTDYGACKQLGPNIIGTNGMMIKDTKNWILRCYGCFKTTHNMAKKWCPKCGKKTLKRVSVTVNGDGSQQFHISTRRPLNTTGKKFSLPAPKFGKQGVNPKLVEDQREAQQRLSGEGEDFMTGSSPFVEKDMTSKSSMLGLQGAGKGNAEVPGAYFNRRNNAVKKKRGNRRKRIVIK